MLHFCWHFFALHSKYPRLEEPLPTSPGKMHALRVQRTYHSVSIPVYVLHGMVSGQALFKCMQRKGIPEFTKWVLDRRTSETVWSQFGGKRPFRHKTEKRKREEQEKRAFLTIFRLYIILSYCLATAKKFPVLLTPSDINFPSMQNMYSYLYADSFCLCKILATVCKYIQTLHRNSFLIALLRARAKFENSKPIIAFGDTDKKALPDNLIGALDRIQMVEMFPLKPHRS